MKYAIINGEKTEAFKGGKGVCPSCSAELIAKCGDVKINHWSHKGTINCDPWWENETEWHRQWKNQFPKEWQEILHFDRNGEKHIADVKTKNGWIIEFQHSYINPEERNSRIAFYSKMVWVIDGLRRETDKIQFQKILEESSQAPVRNVNIRQINFPEQSRLLKEWQNCGVPVFFDFDELNKSRLWLLLPLNIQKEAYLYPIYRENFIKVHKNEGFDELVYKLIPNIQNIIIDYKRNISNRTTNNFPYSRTRRTNSRRF
jgi:hypothetical protein